MGLTCIKVFPENANINKITFVIVIIFTDAIRWESVCLFRLTRPVAINTVLARDVTCVKMSIKMRIYQNRTFYNVQKQ